MASLLLVFAFADTLQYREAGFLGVGNGGRLQLHRRIKGRNDFSNRLFARRTLGQRRGAEGPAQTELAAAGLALAFAKFVLVEGHD